MIYSGSVSGYTFVWVPDPSHVYQANLEMIKNTLSTNYLHCRPETSGLKVKNTFLIYCSFILAGSGTNNYVSGSRKKFRIWPDPDPQHCLIQPLNELESLVQALTPHHPLSPLVIRTLRTLNSALYRRTLVTWQATPPLPPTKSTTTIPTNNNSNNTPP